MEKEKNTNDYKVSLFNDAKSLPVAHATLEDIYHDIKSEVYKDEIAQLRAHIAAGDNKVAETYKKTLPAFTCSLFKGSRIAEEAYIDKWYGLLCIDFDDVPDVKRKVEELKNDHYVKLLFISPSGEGMKCVIATDCTDWGQHGEIYRQASKYFSEKYRLSADGSCKDVSRLCFFSADANAYYNNDSKVFHMQAGSLERAVPYKSVQITDSKTLDERFNSIEQFANAKIGFKEGQRHQHVLLLAAEANRWGLRKDYVLQRVVEDYVEDTFQEGEIVSIVNSAYRSYASEHSSFLIAPPLATSTTDKEWLTDKELSSLPAPTDQWILDGLIRREGLTIISSPPGLCKSTLSTQLLMQVAYSEVQPEFSMFLNRKLFPKHNRCVFVSREDDYMEKKESYDKQIAALNIKPTGKVDFYFPEVCDIEVILHKLEGKLPADVIILDTYNSLYMSTGKDSTNTMGQRHMADLLDSWAKKHQVCVIALHHPIKANFNQEPTMQAISGGGGLSERVRTMISLTELSNQRPECIYMVVSKGNLIDPKLRREYVEIQREGNSFIYTATGRVIPKGGYSVENRETKKKDNLEKRKKVFIELFTDNSELTHSKFCDAYHEKTNYSVPTAARHLIEMVKEGVVKHDEDMGLYSLKAEKNESIGVEVEDVFIN